MHPEKYLFGSLLQLSFLGSQVIGLLSFGAVPLLGSILINVFCPLIIQSLTYVPCKYLFISSATLSWMEVNFLNQNPCIVFHRGLAFSSSKLFSIVLSKSMCISAFGPSSSPLNSFVMLFIHSASSLCFLVAVFQSKIVRFLLHPVAGMFLCNLLPVVDRIIFRWYGMFCFVCNVFPFVDISLIFLFSPVLSGLFPQLVLLSFLMLPFLFCSYIFQRLSFVLSFCPDFVDFLFAFPVEFPILVLIFSSYFLRESQFFQKLISPLHILVNLILLYYSLIYKVVIDLFYSITS